MLGTGICFMHLGTHILGEYIVTSVKSSSCPDLFSINQTEIKQVQHQFPLGFIMGVVGNGTAANHDHRFGLYNFWKKDQGK